MNDLLRRAVSDYFRSASNLALVQEPSHAASDVETHQKKHYVVLRNAKGVLAVYQVRKGGMLKRLRRWPDYFGA
jgi:hypothetical protein